MQATGTNQTSAKPNDGRISEEMFSERPLKDSGRDYRSPTKIQIFQERSICHADIEGMVPSKQECYSNDYRTQSRTHCRACFAKDSRIETRPFTVCFEELSQKREANFGQMLSSGSCRSNRRAVFNTGR